MGFMDAFDVDEQKLELIDQAMEKAPRGIDKRICICGHPMSRHHDATGCRPARFDCPCKRKHAVLAVPDTRYFLSRSEGSGEKHALMRGIFLARKGMAEVFDEGAEWLVEHKCENPTCGKETKLYPVRCDTDFFRTYDFEEDQGISAFFCEECRELYNDSEEAVQAKRASIRQKN